jgi:hypothetical protein
MKKLSLIIIALILVCSTALVGCNKENNGKDYSKLPFTNVSWTREGEHDLETIRFGADGSFSYSCACGNPVNDADLCDGYTYDEATKTIKLDYIEKTDDAVTEIKVVKCEGNELQLDFGGEILTFTK